MSKFNGLKLTSFLMGVFLPLGVCFYLLSELLQFEPRITPMPTQEQVKLPESYVDLFSVDYEMYGKYTIGQDKIVGEVVNNASNDFECNVWLEDKEGSIISDVVSLSPSERGLVFKTTNVYDTAGKYESLLVYDVLIGEQHARIECPYVILVNGGL